MIDPNAIVRACAAYGACQGKTPAEAGAAAQICLFSLEFSAERAIPVSGLLRFDARVESFVLCMIANKDDCTAQRDICEAYQGAESCEEDGCSGSRFPASCNGTIAHFETCHGGFDRQCASAFAECDPQSISGCTDRPETACPPGVSTADRCDGDVRLGCDGTDRVSYHDCARMGGTCGVVDGKADCVYPTIPGSECAQEDYGGRCIGHELVACIANRRVSVTAPAVCP